MQVELVSKLVENHGGEIADIAFFEYGDDAKTHNVVATVSLNRVTLYELGVNKGTMHVLQTWHDEAWDEVFKCCVFAVDKTTSDPLLIVAGKLGVIKILNCKTLKMQTALVGHGYGINYLLNHPLDNNIVLSCSDDESFRIWNIHTKHCLAVFCGHDAHRSSVVCADFHVDGQHIISCSKDHCVKLWRVESLTQWIADSYQHETITAENNPIKRARTQLVQIPIYSKHKVHTNYIDHLRFCGDLVLSKSNESVIKMWMIPFANTEKSIQTIAELRYKKSAQFGSHFAVHPVHDLVAVGTDNGQIYLFELEKYFAANAQGLQTVNDVGDEKQNRQGNNDQMHTLIKPRLVSKYKPIMVQIPDCNVRVYKLAFNRNDDLLVVTGNAYIYRYRLRLT